jgi:hypothetical protein
MRKKNAEHKFSSSKKKGVTWEDQQSETSSVLKRKRVKNNPSGFRKNLNHKDESKTDFEDYKD